QREIIIENHRSIGANVVLFCEVNVTNAVSKEPSRHPGKLSPLRTIIHRDELASFELQFLVINTSTKASKTKRKVLIRPARRIPWMVHRITEYHRTNHASSLGASFGTNCRRRNLIEITDTGLLQL